MVRGLRDWLCDQSDPLTLNRIFELLAWQARAPSTHGGIEIHLVGCSHSIKHGVRRDWDHPHSPAVLTGAWPSRASSRSRTTTFTEAAGTLLISRTAVSAITDQLSEDYQAFCTRDLSGIEVQYLLCDAIFESLRRYGAKEGVLAAW